MTIVDVERLLLVGVLRPGSEVLDILLHEKQRKRTLNKNTGQRAIRDKTDYAHTGPDLGLIHVLSVRGNFISYGLATENTYGSNRTYAMETVEQRLSTAVPLLEVDSLSTQRESGIFAYPHNACFARHTVCSYVA